MDKVIESLNFASRSYWGDPNRFQFYSAIDSFEDSITYNVGDNRAVRTNFTLSLNGYLIPDSINKQIASANAYYGVSQVLFGIETATGLEEFTVKAASGKSKVTSAILSDSINIVATVANDAALTYLGINKTVTGVYSSPTTAVFAAIWAIAPDPLPATGLDNFTFFVNGQYIERAAIVSFTEVGSTSVLVIDPAILGFTFDQTDVLLAVGKFQ
jgi:hypothetical protein